MHRGTADGGGVTSVGDGNLFMAQTHIGHDCLIGSDNIFANAATLAGHVEIANHTTLGAYSGVHQFCRLGAYAFVGGYSVVVKDALPYARTVGNHARCYGTNSLGLKRKGFSVEAIARIDHAFFLLLSSKLNTSQALERIRSEMTALLKSTTSSSSSKPRGAASSRNDRSLKIDWATLRRRIQRHGDHGSRSGFGMIAETGAFPLSSSMARVAKASRMAVAAIKEEADPNIENSGEPSRVDQCRSPRQADQILQAGRRHARDHGWAGESTFRSSN
jgi:hypothetical protein